MTEPFEHPVTFLRSWAPPIIRNLPREVIEFFVRQQLLANSYEIWPQHEHPKFTRRKRIVYAETMQIEFIEDCNDCAEIDDKYLDGLSNQELKQSTASQLKILDKILQDACKQANGSKLQ